MPTKIESLAEHLLTDDEVLVAKRLRDLIRICGIRDRRMRIPWSLIIRVLPKFWKRMGGHYVAIHPIDVYRPLYYASSPSDYVGKGTRATVTNLASHLEGLLALLAPNSTMRKLPFGSLTKELTDLGVLPRSLGTDLLEYNGAVNVPGKHPKANPRLPERLDVRSFSSYDTILCLFITRRLAIELFPILSNMGINLGASWKRFSRRWITWGRGKKIPSWGRPLHLDPLGNYYPDSL